MNEPLENTYFNWLSSKVMMLENPTPSLTYWTLLRALHNTEFVWFLKGDDNRAMDGLELRDEFLHALDIQDVPEWRDLPCSLFEMLIAFSRRAEFMDGAPAKDWFWEFIENLGLKECNDASGLSEENIGEVLYLLVWRIYDPTGRGGLFPMDNPPEDQRNTEIWYQFCEYLVDQDRLP